MIMYRISGQDARTTRIIHFLIAQFRCVLAYYSSLRYDDTDVNDKTLVVRASCPLIVYLMQMEYAVKIIVFIEGNNNGLQ